MNCLSWNIRGMNDPNKISAIKRLCQQHNISIVSILETKIKVHNMLPTQLRRG